MDFWYAILALLAVSSTFKDDNKEIFNFFQGDEVMNEKIKTIKELIADKVKEKIETENLTVKDYEEIAVLLQKIEFAPSYFLGFNGMTKTSEDK